MSRNGKITSSGRILIIDDEFANVRLLERILAKAGYADLRSTMDPREFAAVFATFEPDIILLDLQMPYLDGFAVLAQLKELLAPETILPVVVLTADVSAQTKLRALSDGASDFLTKPFDHAEVIQRVGNLLQTRQLHVQVQAQNEDLERVVQQRTAELQLALSQLKETQQQIIQQERLHAFGTMATGVAHDFNNTLSVILGFGEIALRECEEKSKSAEMSKYLHTIITAAHDGAKMVTRLREFYRPQNHDEPRVSVDLNGLVEQAIALTEPKWKSQSLGSGVKIDILTDLKEVATVAGDAAELREALTNLIFNAVDAMPEGGNIILRTRQENQDVILEIIDTGIGMTEEVRSRCLDPFFSTKGERGTGLGLAMVYGIVERHRGRLDVRSVLGIGTTFAIALPVQAVVAPERTPDAVQIDRSLRILVADDQPILCEILYDYLTKDCHTVVTAANGTEALEKFAHDNFDVVITDQAMPGMTGGELARAIKVHFASTPIILLSGFGEVPSGTAAGAIDYVLSKPVSQIELRHALVRVTSTSRTDDTLLPPYPAAPSINPMFDRSDNRSLSPTSIL